VTGAVLVADDIFVFLRIGGTEILHDGRREALEALIASIREEGIDGEIRYRPPSGRGISWIEVTSIYIGMKVGDAIISTATKGLIDRIAERSKDWAKRRFASGDAVRPQLIRIYGPDGTVLKEVEVKKDKTDD
jgi:PAS domain-containing protein